MTICDILIIGCSETPLIVTFLAIPVGATGANVSGVVCNGTFDLFRIRFPVIISQLSQLPLAHLSSAWAFAINFLAMFI